MRHLVLAVLAAGGLAIAGAAPAAAVDTRYPYCLQGSEYPALYCMFTSYEQCQASASGRLLYCTENPYYQPRGGYDPRGYRGPDRARPFYPRY